MNTAEADEMLVNMIADRESTIKAQRDKITALEADLEKSRETLKKIRDVLNAEPWDDVLKHSRAALVEIAFIAKKHSEKLKTDDDICSKCAGNGKFKVAAPGNTGLRQQIEIKCTECNGTGKKCVDRN